MTGSFKRVLEVHPDGMQEIFHWSAPDRQFSIEYRQDVDATLTAVREKSADTGGWSKSRDFRHVASVPTVVMLELVKRYGPEITRDNRMLARKVLGDADYRYLCVGRVL